MSGDNSFFSLYMGNVSDGSFISIGVKVGSLFFFDLIGSGFMSFLTFGDVDFVLDYRESLDEREEGDLGNLLEFVLFKIFNLLEFFLFKMFKTQDNNVLLFSCGLFSFIIVFFKEYCKGSIMIGSNIKMLVQCFSYLKVYIYWNQMDKFLR